MIPANTINYPLQVHLPSDVVFRSSTA